MITFLNCEGEAYFSLRIKIKNQGEKGIIESVFDIDSKKEYKISIFDEGAGLITYNCRIVGFTMANKPDPKSFVNFDKKGNVEKFCVVDTLKIDYSEEESSGIKSINVSDIRKITEYDNTVFEDMRHIDNFR